MRRRVAVWLLSILILPLAWRARADAPVDPATAATIRAAGEGDAAAQLELGKIYDLGRAVPQKLREAVKWYRLSANGGDARAQLLLANLYNVGQGVAKSPVIAFALYSVSAEREPNGNPARGHRVELAQAMSAAEIESATALAREMAKPGNFAAALDRNTKIHP